MVFATHLRRRIGLVSVCSTNDVGVIKVQLFAAKSRVAPLKTTSLPRLDLCGAVLLINLYQRISQALNCEISSRHFWTNSEIILAWVRGEPSKWPTFVGNRVAEIQRITTEGDWSHVRSEQNPADIISRGMLPKELLHTALWWEGLTWLKEDPSQWPQSTMQLPNQTSATQPIILLCVKESFDVIEKYSLLTKLRRVIANFLRFKTNCASSKSRTPLSHGPLTVEELQNTMMVLIKLHQRENFTHELHQHRQGRFIDARSKILSLNPILDKDSILCVDGRLRNSTLSYTQRHLILLAPNGMLIDLIIRDQHLKNFNMGSQLLLTTLREIYWIIRAKNVIKRVLGICVLCFRLKPRSLTQQMGDLPAARVTPSRAFNNTGVDYAGPFNVKISRNNSSKAYLCLFVCMATKAVHIELVSNLTTELFLNALKRFISRREKCESIFSDNGKNFLGANNALRQMGEFLSHPDCQTKTISSASEQGIFWKFIPPHSPHMGGIWEANIKSVKTHLKIVVNETLLSFEELYTVLTQIEAILNSRLLCPLTNVPDESEVLTPGHFIIGTSLLALSERSVLDILVSRTNRYQLLTQLQQSFWKRLSREYVYNDITFRASDRSAANMLAGMLGFVKEKRRRLDRTQ